MKVRNEIVNCNRNHSLDLVRLQALTRKLDIPWPKS